MCAYLQNDLIESCENDNEFWKKIGRLGIGFERRKPIPLEIIREDGSLSNDLEDIMHKWKTYFGDLLNQHDSEATGSQEATQQDSEHETGYMLNRDISFNAGLLQLQP